MNKNPFKLITATYTPQKRKSSSKRTSASSTRSNTFQPNFNKTPEKKLKFDVGVLKYDLSQIYNNLAGKSKEKLLNTNIQLNHLEKNQKEAIYKIMNNFPLSSTKLYENRILTDFNHLGKKPKSFLKNFKKLEKKKIREEKWMNKRRDGLLRKKLAVFEKKMRIRELNENRHKWFRRASRRSRHVKKNIFEGGKNTTKISDFDGEDGVELKDKRFNEVSLPEILLSKKISPLKKNKKRVTTKLKQMLGGVFGRQINRKIRPRK